MKTVRIGLIQMTNPSLLTVDYEQPTSLVEQAVQEGAELILFPETCPCGYIPNQNAWHLAESREGPTVTWAAGLAKKRQITIGAGFVEYDGTDFYNSYLLADDTGLLGVVRKRNVEAYCYKSGETANVIVTRHGKIGIGICADNHLTAFLHTMMAQGVDLMLMPHARATPYRAVKGVTEKDIVRFKQEVIDLAIIYSKTLGAPTVFVNPVGGCQPMTGILGKFMSPDNFKLQGGSLISLPDGSIMGCLQDKEGVSVVEVGLVKQESAGIAKDYSGWLHQGNLLVRKIMLPVDIWQGRRSYHANKKKFKKRSPT